MKTATSVLILLFLGCSNLSAQSIQDLINTIDLNKLNLTLNEFTGEQTTNVNGTAVNILNREESNNDLAADYLTEQLTANQNLSVANQPFNTNGRNVIATQLGQTNPASIYVVCAHYDSTANYCADDNATGVAAVLEIARILSTQCVENTIVYALWDEEEIGLKGSSYYASQAAANATNILAVVNMDMMGYDGDAVGTPGNNQFDIDYRDIADSEAIKSDLIGVLNTYNLDLSVVEVNPGTAASDHSSFWAQGYSALLVGESWATNDQTPFYHSSLDRVATLDLPYFHEMVKLVMGYMATKAVLVGVDNGVTLVNDLLIANQDSALYQWFNAETNLPIAGETNQSFMPGSPGIYAVEVTMGACSERSASVAINNLGNSYFSSEELSLYPNPANEFIKLQGSNLSEVLDLKLYDTTGKLVKTWLHYSETDALNIKTLPKGIYFLQVASPNQFGSFKVIKE